jgi:hypothetical protein
MSVDFLFVAISVGKIKKHLPMVLQTEIARKKKSFPLEIYRRIYPVGDSVTYRRIHIVGKFVGECLEY